MIACALEELQEVTKGNDSLNPAYESQWRHEGNIQ